MKKLNLTSGLLFVAIGMVTLLSVTSFVLSTAQAQADTLQLPSWTMPINIAKSPNITSFRPKIVVDTRGNQFIFWLEANFKTGDPSTFGLFFSKYENGVFTTPVPIVGPRILPASFDIAIDKQDVIHLVYDINWQIFYKKYSNGTWSLPETVSLKGGSATVAVDSNNSPHVMYIYPFYPNGAGTYYTKRTSSQWTEPLLLTSDTGQPNGINKTMAIDEHDNIHIIWIDTGPLGGYLSQIIYRKFDGTSWSNPKTIATGYATVWAGIESKSGIIAIIYNKGVIITGSKIDEQVYILISKDAGDTWTAPIKISEPQAVGWAWSHLPALSIDNAGDIHTMWGECGLSDGCPPPVNRGVPYRLYSNDQLSEVQDISGGTLVAGQPNITTSEDKIYAVWTSNGDIYYSSTKITNPAPLLFDLSIEEVKPIQVVENADVNGDGTIDLVAGKPAVVRVRPRVTASDSFNQNQSVTIELSLGEDTLSITKTLAELKTLADNQNGYIDFSVTPITEGNSDLFVVIDSSNSIDEQDETNNQVVQELNVKQTDNLRLSYIPFTFPSLPNNFLVTSVMSSEFIDATYPVADVESDYSTSEYVSGLPARISNKKSVIFDLLSFWLWGKLLYPTSDQIFGVVSHDYFPYHDMETTVGGHAVIGLNAVSLITEDYWTAAAHELGHAHGLWTVGPEEYELYDGGRDASGYWVKNQMEIANGQCFMGRAGQRESFYYDDTTPIWVDNKDYGLLFKERLEDKTDPEILLLSGWVEKNGTIFVNPLYRTSGNIDTISGNEYTVKLLDFDGNLISSFSFDISFQLKTDPPVELDVAPFALTIPYHDDVWQVRISKEEEVVAQISAPTRLLHDAIDSIPQNGFIGGKELRRGVLHNKVEALEKQIESKSYIGAVGKLKNDIREKINEWLTDYKKETPLVLTKEEILNLIDSLIQGIESNAPMN